MVNKTRTPPKSFTIVCDWFRALIDFKDSGANRTEYSVEVPNPSESCTMVCDWFRALVDFKPSGANGTEYSFVPNQKWCSVISLILLCESARYRPKSIDREDFRYRFYDFLIAPTSDRTLTMTPSFFPKLSEGCAISVMGYDGTSYIKDDPWWWRSTSFDHNHQI